jgi:putative tryptophan/tyrosine transport system substrate-binding protein
VTIEYRWAQGEHNRLPTLVADLIQRKVAVIVIVLAAFAARVAGVAPVPFRSSS